MLIRRPIRIICICRSASLLLALLACGGDPAATAIGTVRRDSAGVIIVESRAPRLNGEHAWSVDTTLGVTIGRDEGPAAELFTDVRSVFQLTNGTIVAANGGTAELRAFTANGVHLWTTGRRGPGPGEFSTLSRLVRIGGDSVVAFDASQRRLSLFAPSGKFVRSFTLELPEGVAFSGTLTLAGAWGGGSIAVVQHPVRSGMQPAQVTRRPATIYRYDATGRVVGKVATIAGPEMFEGSRGLGSIRAVPFGRSAYFALGDSGTVSGDAVAFELAESDATGKLVRILRREFRPTVIGAAEIAAERERLKSRRRIERALQLRGMPAPMLARLSEEEDRTIDIVPFATTFPAYDAIVLSRDGALWVRRFDPNPSGPSIWSVFDRGGAWVCDVGIPARFRLHEVTSSSVLGVQLDELDVPRIRLFPIIR